MALDEFVLARYQFRLTDLIEAALSYSDWRLQSLRNAWPDGPLNRDDDAPEDEDLRARVRRIAKTPVTLNAAEVDSVSLAPDAGEWLSTCGNPDQAAAAWRWATRPASTLKPRLGPGGEVLGATLAVKTPWGDQPIPVSLVLQALEAATVQLAYEAAEDLEVQQRLQSLTEQRALKSLGMDTDAAEQEYGVRLTDAAAEGDEARNDAVIVAVPGRRHAYAIGIASGLDIGGLTRAVGRAIRAVERFDAATIQAADSQFDPNGLVVRAVLYGGPLHGPPPTRPGVVCIHVDDWIEIALEAVQTQVGNQIGRDLLWQFLDELATMPGVSDLRAIDFDDIWWHWLNSGVLNPTGREDLPIVLQAVPDERAWWRASIWEPIDEVLAASGLPPSWDWASARLDEDDGQATLGFHGAVCQVLTEPPVVIYTPLDPALRDLGVDPVLASGLADGIRLTIVNRPDVAETIRRAIDLPLLLHIHMNTERASASTPETVGIGFSVGHTPLPTISLLLGPDWLETLAADSERAHAALGAVLAEGLGRITDLSPAARRAFLAAWNSAPPALVLHFGKTTLKPSFQGRVNLPRSTATSGRARRALARTVIQREIPDGLYLGHDAVQLCRDQILPAAQSVLTETVADWSPAALYTVARHLNDAHADRDRRATELALALAAPWGSRWQETALDEPEPAERTRPLELLLEILGARTSTGLIEPDRFDIAEATDIAGEVLHIGLSLSAARSSLHSLSVLVQDGAVGLAPVPDQANASLPQARRVALDMPAYLNAHRIDRLRLQPRTPKAEHVDIVPGDATEPRPFEGLNSFNVPGSLLTADTRLKAICGTGIDGINAVLGTAVTWTSGTDDVVEIARAELLARATEWAQLPSTEIDAAIDRLTLTPEQLQSQELRPWEQEKRQFRLATRPLLVIEPGRLLVVPWRICATQSVYLNYMIDGRLPWHSSEIPEPVRNAFTQFRKVQNKDLERDVVRCVTEVGMPHQANVEPHQAARYDLRIPGEIDVIIADPSRSRLWICEVKDISTAMSPSTIATRVRRFFDKGGHVDKLNRSITAVQANPAAVARLLHVDDPDRAWQVIPLMITRRVEPAAFAADPTVPFVAVADLRQALQANQIPPPGHFTVERSQ